MALNEDTSVNGEDHPVPTRNEFPLERISSAGEHAARLSANDQTSHRGDGSEWPELATCHANRKPHAAAQQKLHECREAAGKPSTAVIQRVLRPELKIQPVQPLGFFEYPRGALQPT